MARKAKNIRRTQQTPHKAVLPRLLPPLVFLLALCLLVVCFYDSGYTSLPPTAKRYDTAKADIQALLQDSRRVNLREPWEKLAAEFQDIYKTDPDWPNRPAALFRAAECLEDLARRSFARSDAKKAVAVYTAVADRHADSRLADDALFRAARLSAAWLKDDAGALGLLARLKSQYPRGDMLPQALALEKALQASADGRTAPEARQVAAADGKPAARDVADTEDTAAAAANPAAPAPDKAPKPAPTPAVQAPAALPVKDASPAAPQQPTAAAHRDKSAAALAQATAGLKPWPAKELLARYTAGKASMARLRADKTRSCWRQPWEELRDDFLRVYLGRKTWAAAPGALFRAAQSQEALAGCSHLNAEYRQARDLYLALAEEFPRSALADDALLHAAALSSGPLNDPAAALALLDRLDAAYPKGDMRPQAAELRARLAAPSLGTAQAASDGPGAAQTAPGSAGAAAARTAQPRHVSDMARQLGLTVRRVFIDAGHGGRDPGTSHNGVLERVITLDVARTLGRLLAANGLDVVYSRTEDTTLGLRQRTDLANAAGADLFVSIHVNANNDARVCGFETYYLDLAADPEAARVAALENAHSDRSLGEMQNVLADVMLNARVQESRALARQVQRLALFRLQRRAFSVRNNGVKSAPFHVLLGAQMPAVLVELGYCTHADEARNLKNPRYRLALAEGLAEGILAYRDQLLQRRTAQNSLTPQGAGAM